MDNKNTKHPEHSKDPSLNSSAQTAAPVAVVTGAGSGIGAATAERFAKEGWDVVLIGRRPDALEATRKKIGARGISLPLDLAERDSLNTVNRWAQMSSHIASRIHAIVHNAGIYEPSTTLTSTDVSWHRTFELNVFSIIRLTQALFPYLKNNQGSLVTVSSTLGLKPTAGTAAYSASKAALINWSQSFALEAAPLGVRVNCVCPGIVDTPIHEFHTASDKTETLQKLGPLQPLGRIGRPEEIAHMIWTLAGPGSEWTTGATISIDGGIGLT
ncbi:MAG: SDR family oxidoreductase [Bdellovibrionales bacterium]|nr:SDR family oxidoreductase [Bdellovibrionales bacterium]